MGSPIWGWEWISDSACFHMTLFCQYKSRGLAMWRLPGERGHAEQQRRRDMQTPSIPEHRWGAEESVGADYGAEEGLHCGET